MKKNNIILLIMIISIYTLVGCSNNQIQNEEIIINETESSETENSTELEEVIEEKNNIEISNENIMNNIDISNYINNIDNKTIDATIYLDYQAGIDAKVYKWIKSDDGKYYTFAYIDENGEPVKLAEAKINVGANNKESIDNRNNERREPNGQKPQGEGMRDMPGGMMEMMMKNMEVLRGVYINANVTNLENQTMLIYAPAEYFDVDEDGNVININYDNNKNGYTAKTAPIVFLNECGGWKSSSPRSCETSYIDEGFIYVTCGARSRDAIGEDNLTHTGKAPMQMADLKSGIIQLRANDNVIPGDKNKIISIGTSGGGQMSSILGASGDMKEYYPYMYEAGALGVTKNEDGVYESAYQDSIFAAQNYCPIADIENADMAYAWWWVDLVDDGGIYNERITEFEKRLQELEANAYIDYLNSLQLKDENGNILTLDGLRSGSYYDKILDNLSNALNQFVKNGEIDVDETYGDYSNWLEKEEDGSYKVIDMKGFMIGTGLVNSRNKAVPGFDTQDKSAENNAFGKPEQDSVHFSKSVAKIMKDNYDELSTLDGFNKEYVYSYIEDALDGENAEYIENQTNLLNATHILLGIDGIEAVNPVKHYRNRSGSADQHTSFGIGYNILLAAQMRGIDIDYSLVWNMPHGSNEGTSTGTFIDWVNKISKSENGNSNNEKKLGNNGPQGMRGGMGAGMNFLDETAKSNLTKVSNEVKNKYKEFVYNDTQTDLSVKYGLFIPDTYDTSDKEYPLIMFIGDATTTGNTINQILENCIGSVIWATEEEQAKHESFVLVPTFDEKLIDDTDGNLSMSEYMDVIIRMIENIENEYRVDKNKIYSTGQSMGCMTTLYLTANNPDLFAATLLVDGQWEISQIQGIKDRKFVYFAAEGDKKALEGQNKVKNYLKENNVEYSEVYDVDAKADAQTLNNIADELFNKGNDKNFITWKLNSTYANEESNGSPAGEHMTSFYYGYNIERVRDWLFEQTKK